jgi:hypothetical protein
LSIQIQFGNRVKDQVVSKCVGLQAATQGLGVALIYFNEMVFWKIPGGYKIGKMEHYK